MNKIEKLALELLENEKCQINVRKAGAYRFPASYRFDTHKHIEYEINYVSSGKCVMTFENEYVPLKMGECVIVAPFFDHGFLVDTKSGCKINQVEMSIKIPKDMVTAFPFCEGTHPYYRLRDCEGTVPLMEQIARFHRNELKNEYRDALLELSVIQLIVALGYHTKKEEDVTVAIKNKKIVEIMRYIQDHYNEQIQIEELAKERNISSRYVRKYFAEEIGMTCSDYITVMRINKAKELLWETTKSITDIALEVGYGTPQYFCRIFKNEIGISPSDYRMKWKEKQMEQDL